MGEDSPWTHYYNLFIGSLKPFEFDSINVFSNYDQGQFAQYAAESGNFKLKGYTYYEDDPTKVEGYPFEYTGGMYYDLIQTKNQSTFRE